MRRQAMLLGAGLAMLGAGIPIGQISGSSLLTASNSVPATGGKAAQSAPVAGKRQKRFVSAVDFSDVGGYRKRPHGSVARDKRDARKARNRQRSKS